MPRPNQLDLDRLLDRGYRYALALTHDSNRAEDLLHDAVVSVLRRRPLDNAGYLLTTIRNRFIDLYRRERLVVMHPLDESSEDALEQLDEADPTLDPERLEQALATLRPPEREAIYLSAAEGYTAQEIADLTGRSRGTVLSLVHRARLKMRRFLSPDSMEAQS
jgi:RNA polymerase sigma-70 factor (ECF subfamily)